MNDELSAEVDAAELPGADGVLAPTRPETRPPPPAFALMQAFTVCGVPTQIVVGLAVVLMTGIAPMSGGGLSLEFIATVSLLDTALVALLIWVFLLASGENSRDVFIGRRPPLGEIGRGLALVPLTFLIVVGLVTAVRAVAPWMHNVKVSPLEAFLRNPLDAAIFLVVVVLAGGVREELQRGFILHRFGQRLGGMWVGNLSFGLAFGLMHFDQGWDVALVIGLLGLAWGAFFIRRGSVLVSVANHAGFNAAQVAQQVLASSLGLGK